MSRPASSDRLRRWGCPCRSAQSELAATAVTAVTAAPPAPPAPTTPGSSPLRLRLRRHSCPGHGSGRVSPAPSPEVTRRRLVGEAVASLSPTRSRPRSPSRSPALSRRPSFEVSGRNLRPMVEYLGSPSKSRVISCTQAVTLCTQAVTLCTQGAEAQGDPTFPRFSACTSSQPWRLQKPPPCRVSLSAGGSSSGGGGSSGLGGGGGVGGDLLDTASANAAAAAAAVAAVDGGGGGGGGKSVGGDSRGHPPFLIPGGGEAGQSFVADLRSSAAGFAYGGAPSTGQVSCAPLPPASGGERVATAAGGAELYARLDGLGKSLAHQIEEMRSEMQPLLVGQWTCTVCALDMPPCIHCARTAHVSLRRLWCALCISDTLVQAAPPNARRRRGCLE